MHVYRLIVIVTSFFFLVGIAAAADLSPSTISSSNTGWLVANGVDVSTITVHVQQGSPGTDVSGAQVTFSITDPTLGTISPASVTTGTDGIATAVFTTKTKSGIATISATILYNDGVDTTHYLGTIQRVDHDIAQNAYYDYKSSVPVGTGTHVNITLVDRTTYENRIDNKNSAEVHTVHLTMTGPAGSGLFDGSAYVSQIDKTTDADGNVSVDVWISSVAGDNIIQMDPVGNFVLPPPIYIKGVANSANPFTITQIAPYPSSWPADGESDHYFDLYYVIKDQYGNPVDGTVIQLTSSAGESKTITTDNGGIAYTQYGPKDVSGFYTLMASSASNATILCTEPLNAGYCSQTVEFFSREPVEMVMSASPQTMVSTDVDPSSKAIVRARVMDVRGNPVTEYPRGTPVTVTFSMGPVTYPGAPDELYTETVAPSLSSTTATMGEDGFATIEFIPGTFAKSGETGYNATATGTCTVTATWKDLNGIDINRDVTFTWKNYPFLTLNSEFSRTIGKVGDFLDITIKIKGDGAALQTKPIDVVLALDRSGSMLEGELDDNMVASKAAASSFASHLNLDRDQIGIVTFGDVSGNDGYAKLAPSRAGTTRWDWSDVNYYWYWVRYDSSSKYSVDCPGCYYGGSNEASSSYSITSPHQIYLNLNYNNGNPQYYGGAMTSTDLSFGPHSQAEVDAALNTIVPSGGTPTREAIYRAVNQFPAAGSGRVRAIILQTDGAWNTGGDPEALTNYNPDGSYYSSRFTASDLTSSTSVIKYANDSKIALYTIGLGVPSGSALETTLKRYAANDGGIYYPASDASKLNEIYNDIAGQLNQQASGATSADINFGSNALSVDGSILGDSEEIGDYLDYIADPVGGRLFGEGSEADSTFIYKYHVTPAGATVDYYRQVRDDTQNWTPEAKLLQFDVGRMILNDTWQTTFRLNLTKQGQLILFPECGSTVTFIDSSTGMTQTGCIPSGPVSVYESKTDQGFGQNVLKVENLGFIEGATLDPDIWKISWDTTYTGTTVAEETIEYWSSAPGSIPATYAVISPIYANPASETRTLEIDTRTWKQGETYTIKVSASSYDGGSSYATITKQKELDDGKIFIRLE